jgi:(p)ppGpp synthase/HD superfamily hydrolase
MPTRSRPAKAKKQSTKIRSASNAKTTSQKKTPRTRSGGRAEKKSNLPNAAFYPYELSKHGDLAWQYERFEKILKKFSPEDSARILKAYRFADERHKQQFRADGTPYIIHPVRLANILMNEWAERDANVVIAGLLHDVIEDTQTTIREVKEAFGDLSAKLIDGMTMWKGSESQEVYLQRISRGSEKLRLIKCADALDNLRSWHECPKDIALKFPRWWRQTKDYVVPIAETTHTPAAKLLKQIVEDPWYLQQAQMA